MREGRRRPQEVAKIYAEVLKDKKRKLISNVLDLPDLTVTVTDIVVLLTIL
jgi:hypothetical protein